MTQARTRPAWRGIAGWSLMLTGAAVGAAATWPVSGLTLAGVALVVLGAYSVWRQVSAP